MRIGILSQLKQKKITGINRVTVGTLEKLLQIDPDDLFVFLGSTPWLPFELETIDILYDSADVLRLNYALATHDLDIVHSHYRPFDISNSIPVAKILTIHDLIPLLHPEWKNNQYEYFNETV